MDAGKRIRSVASRHYGVTDDLSAIVITVNGKVAQAVELKTRRPADAVRLLEEALAIGKGALGTDHALILEAEANLGFACLASGSGARALELGRETHRRCVETFGSQNDLTVRIAWLH